jgi:hypothetical protein
MEDERVGLSHFALACDYRSLEQSVWRGDVGGFLRGRGVDSGSGRSWRGSVVPVSSRCGCWRLHCGGVRGGLRGGGGGWAGMCWAGRGGGWASAGQSVIGAIGFRVGVQRGLWLVGGRAVGWGGANSGQICATSASWVWCVGGWFALD